ncbi:CoA transferase [Chitinimonas koreensis]|nr:CoA transferase [Chitinimonas koreensis]
MPLADLTLVGPWAQPHPAHAALAASLCRQARALGMRVRAQPADSAGALAFSLRLAEQAVDCRILGGLDGAPASEYLVQAATGLMSVHGRANAGAAALGLDYVATLTATLALQGALAALLAQRRGAAVDRCELSMASAALLAVGQYLAGATVEDGAERLLPSSCPPEARPPFVSADAVVFELETLDAEPWRAFWAEIGIAADCAGQGWRAFQLRYAKAVAPLPAELAAALSQRPYADIADVARRHGVAICRQRAGAERRADGDLPPPDRPWAFRSAGTGAGAAALPPLQAGLPLAGLTVVESCRRIQGPLAGLLLHRLGAGVVRIEPPGGDPLRGMPPMAGDCSARFDALNGGKRIREIDIRTAAGRDAALTLAAGAEVFLHNWAPGKAEQLRLGAEDLHRANPDLVYAYAGGWGAGAAVDLPGTDFMVQAWSGVADRIAAAGDGRGGSLFTVLDVLGGAVAALGIVAALLARSLGHGGGTVESALLGAADLLTPGSPEAPPPALQGLFATRSGLLAIDCAEPASLQRLLDAAGLARPDRATLAEALRTRTAADWQAALAEAGVPAVPVAEDLAALARDPRFAACLDLAGYARVRSPWSFR